MIAGGLVTSTGSGLSVPDWPLSYGQFFPPMIGGIRFEHSHRLIAATVGLLTLVLGLWFLWAETRKWLKALAVAAFFAVIIQAVLGGITVKYLLPMPVSVAHAALGQIFFSLVTCLALFTSSEWQFSKRIVSKSAASFQRTSAMTAGFVFLQLIAGAAVRHGQVRLIEIHLFLVFFIFIHIIFLNLKLVQDASLRAPFLWHIFWLDIFFIGQIFLGLGSFFYKFVLVKSSESPLFWEVIFSTAHQTTGALILSGFMLLTLRSFRLVTRLSASADSSDYLALMKPKVTLAALATTLVGYVLASPSFQVSTPFLHVLLGSFLVGGGSNALNQYFERDVDQKMKRTENRPLPRGRLKPSHVLGFGLPVVALGVAELFFFVNHLTAVLGSLTFFSYVFAYTPLKRRTSMNTFVGALPGALPVVMGWTASRGALGAEPLILFLILFLWQIPHFFAIAWVHREDYRRSGLKMLPAEDPDGRQTALRIILYCALLLPATLLPFFVGFSGGLYLGSAALAGILLMALAVSLFRRRMQGAKQFVSASIYYLLILMVFLVVDKF